MKRREFIGATGTALAANCFPQGFTVAPGKLHIVTLSFDDGFRKSFLRTAEIYEKFGFSACFNIVAGAHLPGTVVVDDYMPREQFGDFGVWNELQDRGHEVMIHGYRHAHLARLPMEKAKELILKSLDVFSKELRGFDPKKAVFNFPYNESTPELEEWLSSVVMAFRTRGGALNPVPGLTTCKITTGGWGPGNAEKHVDETMKKLLALPEGWMVYNLHGLDEEGWGPIRPAYLERLLARLRQIDSVRIIPTGRALMQAKAGSFANR
jgi:peptidoglycan/xylan/chitin deacetylase (PgdA/CDA1 family)